MSSPWNFGRGDLVWGVNDLCGYNTDKLFLSWNGKQGNFSFSEREVEGNFSFPDGEKFRGRVIIKEKFHRNIYLPTLE